MDCSISADQGGLLDTGDLKLIRGENNSPMYHLAFFSKNTKGLEFWRETMAKTEKQGTLWPRGEF